VRGEFFNLPAIGEKQQSNIIKKCILNRAEQTQLN